MLPLNPQTTLTWGDMVPYSDYGVAIGDVQAAVSISGLLGKLNKPTKVRISDHYSYEDLHDSPSAVIGAFNNKWTMQMTSGLHFGFVEERGVYSIKEDVQGGRIWLTESNKLQQIEWDFAIVSNSVNPLLAL